MKRRKRRGKKARKPGNLGTKQSNIKEYDNTKVIEEALMYPERANLKAQRLNDVLVLQTKTRRKSILSTMLEQGV